MAETGLLQYDIIEKEKNRLSSKIQAFLKHVEKFKDFIRLYNYKNIIIINIFKKMVKFFY